jgi:hypothetical protein
MLFSKDEYRNIAKLQGLTRGTTANNNNTDIMPSRKNRKNSSRAGGMGNIGGIADRRNIIAAPAAVTTTGKASRSKAVTDDATTNVRPSSMDNSIDDATTTTDNDENASPNVDMGYFIPPGKPRESFVGSKSSIAVISPVVVSNHDDDDDDEVDDINGVSDATDGNSLESLSPYKSYETNTRSSSRPTVIATGGGGSIGSGDIGGGTTWTTASSASAAIIAGSPPPSEMRYSTVLTTTSLYNLMGGPADDSSSLTPRTLELSNVLDALSFEFPSPKEEGMNAFDAASALSRGDDDMPPSPMEDDSMTFIPGDDGISMSSPSPVDDESVYPPADTTTTTIENSFDVVQTIYGFVKDAWAKGKHVPVVSVVFDVTESVAANIIDRILDTTTTTSNNRGIILLDIDERIMKPRMKMIDDAIVSPSIAEVCRVVEMVVRMVDGMVIGPIASGPLGGIFADRNGKNVDVALL